MRKLYRRPPDIVARIIATPDFPNAAKLTPIVFPALDQSAAENQYAAEACAATAAAALDKTKSVWS
jgi:hypothetical protein